MSTLLTSNMQEYLRKLSCGTVKAYPESTSPIPIDVAEYIANCKSGDVDEVTHIDLFNNSNHPSHRKAKLAEEFFTEQVIDSLAKQALDPLATKEEQATKEFTGAAG